jgi:hypothetical protein
MGRKNLVIVFIIAVSFSSCCIPLIQKTWYNTSEGFERPKKNRFKLAKAPYILKPTDGISTDGVYQHDIIVKSDNGRTIHITSFFRFFSNGRYMEGALGDQEPIHYYNNLERGHVGYYTIVDNEVVLEQFSVGAQDCGKYAITKLKINETGFGDFKKIKVEGLKGVPDW